MQNRFSFRRGAVSVAALVVAGNLAACSHAPKETRTEELDSQSRHLVDDSLASSAARAAKAQETLAQIERARTEPAPTSIDTSGLPAEIRRNATMNWSGPGVEAVRQVAGLIGYEFHVVGNPSSVPPMVAVAASDVPVAKILEDIGLQVQGTAQVVVDPNVKRIEFRYVAMYPGASTGGPAPASAHRSTRHYSSGGKIPQRSAPSLTK